jgi:hypothetical protein
MNKLLTLFILSFAVACGTSGGSSSNRNPNAGFSAPPSINSLSVRSVAVSTNQTGGLVHSGSFVVTNSSGSPIEMIDLVGTFNSSNKFIDRVGVQITQDGRVLGFRPWLVEYHNPFVEVSIPMDSHSGLTEIPANGSSRFDLWTRPGSANTAGLLLGDTFFFQFKELNTFFGKLQVTNSFPVVTVGSGGILDNGLTSSNSFPVSPVQLGPRFLLYQETLINMTTFDQGLVDYVFRFRSGPRQQPTNLKIKGIAELEYNGVIIDSVAVHGNINTTDYKMSLLGQSILAGVTADIRIYVTIDNCENGDSFLIDRTNIGSDHGVNYFPTKFGGEIDCP